MKLNYSGVEKSIMRDFLIAIHLCVCRMHVLHIEYYCAFLTYHSYSISFTILLCLSLRERLEKEVWMYLRATKKTE